MKHDAATRDGKSDVPTTGSTYCPARYGENLRPTCVNEADDFLYIPAGVPHQPRNLSDTEPARAIVARNTPNEQE